MNKVNQSSGALGPGDEQVEILNCKLSLSLSLSLIHAVMSHERQITDQLSLAVVKEEA